LTSERAELPPAASAAQVAPSDAPDWSSISEDVRCPLCDYALRGLAEPRCPECGYRFEWPDLTDPVRRRHRYLFEHHPEHNVWSFARTALGGLRPARFWTSLHPAQRSKPRRLALYALSVTLVLATVVAGHYALYFPEAAATARFRRGSLALAYAPGTSGFNYLTQQGRSLQSWLDEFEPVPPSRKFYRRAWDNESQWAIRLAAFWLLWPWLVLAALLLFRISMRRARIRPAHVLRCVVYSYDVALWVAAAAAAAVALRGLQWSRLAPRHLGLPPALIPTDVIFQYRRDLFTDALFWAGVVAVIIAGYRLTVALRRYLRFDHPAATVAAAHVVAGLALVLMLVLARHWW
jgi:hypothetical protein